MDISTSNRQPGWAALSRLVQIARGDSGQAGRVANFLLAWHNADENGGWDPSDLWNVDASISDDMLTVVRLIRDAHCYPEGLGFEDELQSIWRLWRKPKEVPACQP